MSIWRNLFKQSLLKKLSRFFCGTPASQGNTRPARLKNEPSRKTATPVSPNKAQVNCSNPEINRNYTAFTLGELIALSEHDILAGNHKRSVPDKPSAHTTPVYDSICENDFDYDNDFDHLHIEDCDDDPGYCFDDYSDECDDDSW